MEAVGSIKAHEIRATEAIQTNKQASLRKQEEPRESKAHRIEPQKAVDRGEASEETQKKIERIAEAMNSFVKSTQRDLDITVHKETGRMVVKVLSHETGEVIREIPPEELLDLASKMEEMAGALLNKSA
jgi:flagellar protein FlaG